MAVVASFARFFGGSSGANGDYGSVPNTLASDYESDWQYIDGVVTGYYIFAPQRQFRGDTLTAPTDGVKARQCNPTQNEIAIAIANSSYEQNDCVWTIWAQTLMDGDAVIEPMKEDKLVVDSVEWRILSVKRTVDSAQWRCMCRRSVK